MPREVARSESECCELFGPMRTNCVWPYENSENNSVKGRLNHKTAVSVLVDQVDDGAVLAQV